MNRIHYREHTGARKQVLFIHCGGAQGPHDGSYDLVAYLRMKLGAGFEVRYPKMPAPEHPQYVRWKRQLERELAALDNNVILIGHSLGGSVLLKYLSEENYHNTITALFLVAAPYWGKENWVGEEYSLREDFNDRITGIPRIFLYHAYDDEVVPFSHMQFYASKLPGATVRELESPWHLFRTGLPELIADIRRLP